MTDRYFPRDDEKVERILQAVEERHRDHPPRLRATAKALLSLEDAVRLVDAIRDLQAQVDTQATRVALLRADLAAAETCPFCGHREQRDRYGCPNCHGEGLEPSRS